MTLNTHCQDNAGVVSGQVSVSIDHFWRDLKIAVQYHSPSKLTELERICRKDWENVPKYSCAKLVESYPIILAAVIAAKSASTKY